jgi:sugar phosphate isomerase/epimerase
MTGPGNNQPEGQWNGVACPAPRGGGPGGAPGGAAGADAAGRPGGAGGPGGGGGGRGRGEQTPEQKAAADAERKWRLALPMSVFTDLKKMYNDAGVTIYAVKDVRQDTDEDLDYTFTVAKTLGASHVTLELPAGANAEATLKRMGEFAVKHKMFAAYHTHQQGSMTAFDQAFAISKGNMANVDLGHFVAATNPQGSPLDFLNKFHDRISSFHLKDRTTQAHCALNLAWGTGETPIKEILRLVRDKKWDIPGSIELEYQIPQGSNSVIETKKCFEYCKAALEA